MEKVSFRAQINTANASNNKEKKPHSILLNTGIAAAVAVAGGAIASSIKELQGDQIVIGMKENDAVKKHFDENMAIARENAPQILHQEINTELKDINPIFEKILLNSASAILDDNIEDVDPNELLLNNKELLDPEEKDTLIKYKLENKSYNDLSQHIDLLKIKKKLLSGADPKELANIDAHLGKFISHDGRNTFNLVNHKNKVYIAGKKVFEGTADDEELQLLNKVFNSDNPNTSLSANEIKTKLGGSLEEFDKVLFDDLNEKLLIMDIDEITSMSSFSQYIQDKKDKLTKEYTEIKTGLDKQISDMAEQYVSEEKNILNQEKFSEIRENVAKSLKKDRTIKWAAGAAVVGGLLSGAVTYFTNKSRKVNTKEQVNSKPH